MRKSLIASIGILLAVTACGDAPESNADAAADQQEREFFMFGESAESSPKLDDAEAREKDPEFFNFSSPMEDKNEDSTPSCCNSKTEECPWHVICR